MTLNMKARINNLFVKHPSWNLFGRTAEDIQLQLEYQGVKCNEKEVTDVLSDESAFVCEIKEKDVAYYRPVVKEPLKRKRQTPERYTVPVSTR